MARYLKQEGQFTNIASGPSLPEYTNAIIHHGDNAEAPRPPGFVVTWIGSVRPDNMIDGDFWEDPTDSGESVDAYMRRDGSTDFTAPVTGVEPTQSEHLATRGFILGDGVTGLRQIITFETDGTFEKGDYPWLRAVKVTCVGGGGGGGGSAITDGSQNSEAGSGGGGGTGISFVLESALDPSESITVGDGGSGGTIGQNGNAGGSSSFGGHASGEGGLGGAGGVAASTGRNRNQGGAGGNATGGIAIRGQDGHHGIVLQGAFQFVNASGGSTHGGGRRPLFSLNTDGDNGYFYGGGGTGARSDSNSSGNVGGNGANGIVIVELYG